MGSTLDLNIASHEYIEFCKVLLLIEDVFNIKIVVDEVEIIDDWQYSNAIYTLEIDSIYKYIEENKIVNIQLDADSKFKMGCQIEKETDIYLMSFWINTEQLEYLDCNWITPSNEMFYDKLIVVISELSNIYDVIISAIGVESTLKYKHKLEDIILESYNISMWFINDKSLKYIEGFQIKEISDQSNIFKKVKV